MATGGAGGLPNGTAGANGDIGSSDGSSGNGGAGANSPFGTGGAGGTVGDSTSPGHDATGFGAGGGGAAFTDRTGNLNWVGGAGSPGMLKIYWGPQNDPNFTITPK